jgi:beta-lactamase class A
MGYCATQWISDYTYAGITTRVAAVNGNPAAMVLALAQTLSKWRVLLLDARGPRWGVPIEQEVSPEGEPEMATIYDKTGAVLTSVVVYRTEIGDMEASMVWVPEPKPDWYAVAVTGAPPHPFAAPVTTPRP